jgi:hypothetical protein
MTLLKDSPGTAGFSFVGLNGRLDSVESKIPDGTDVDGTVFQWNAANGRLVAAKRPFANIADRPFNADPTGTTDADTAIQAASAAAVELYAPEGEYRVNGATLTNSTLKGPGTIKWKAGSTTAVLTLAGAAGLEGVKFDGSANAGTVPAIVMSSAPRAVIERCTFNNFQGRTIRTDVLNSPHGQVRDCFFDGCQSDTVCIRSSDWHVAGNTFTNTTAGHSVRVGLFTGDPTTDPVVGTIIRGNTFKDSTHVGVCCEIYSQGVQIVGNSFRNLNQAIKCEGTGGTVWDIEVVGNRFNTIAITTALNLQVPQVTFNSNRVYNSVGGLLLGNDFNVVGNFFDTVGDATNATIATPSSAVRGTIASNTIKNAPFRGISTAGNSTVTGNAIFASIEAAINIVGAGNVVTDNVIDGAVNAVKTNSTLANSIVRNNVGRNISGTPLSGFTTNNANFATVLVKDNPGCGELATALVIASDALTIVGPTCGDLRVDTEGAAATDDLATINAGVNGQIIVVRTSSSSRDVTLKDGTGNLRLEGDMVLDTNQDTCTLMWSDSLVAWVELARANNA